MGNVLPLSSNKSVKKKFFFKYVFINISPKQWNFVISFWNFETEKLIVKINEISDG